MIASAGVWSVVSDGLWCCCAVVLSSCGLLCLCDTELVESSSADQVILNRCVFSAHVSRGLSIKVCFLLRLERIKCAGQALMCVELMCYCHVAPYDWWRHLNLNWLLVIWSHCLLLHLKKIFIRTVIFMIHLSCSHVRLILLIRIIIL